MINVSNIERFATHDGPGIRTTIFLKGCPLHCPWCANPETWTIHPVLMHNEKKCVQCHRCQKACSKQAISFHPQFTLNTEFCDSCAECTKACVLGALKISGCSMQIQEILDEVKKDDDYYNMSNGGITLSGGEPLLQKEVLDLLKSLKENHYHVAVETTGNVSLEWLKQVEKYIDLFLFDVKHVDEKKLKEVTGGNLNQIVKNLEYISKTHSVIVRTPVIPGFNQDVVRQIMDKTKELGIQEINLLPYHSLGKNKWHELKKEYLYEDEKMMDKSVLEEDKGYGESIGLKVKIGG